MVQTGLPSALASLLNDASDPELPSGTASSVPKIGASIFGRGFGGIFYYNDTK